ncbi:MAG TPA: hypothetical protein VEC13_00845 [Candidatus Paceibacterota bacterium]|nr:hypothetical protein [Candidatus Paceibacterota bacterium]
MKKIFLLLVLLLCFSDPEFSHAVSPNLSVELIEVERTRSGFDKLDAIVFWVKVTNKSMQPVNNVSLNLRVLKGKEKTSNGSVHGSNIVSIPPNQSITHSIGAHMIESSKSLTGKAEFALSDEFVMSEEEFKNLEIFSYPITSKTLPKSVNKDRGKLTMKASQSGIPKVFVRGSKNAPLLALSLKSTKDVTFQDPWFTYLASKGDLGVNEITDVSLWNGKTKLCGPIAHMAAPQGAGFENIENFVSFTGCNIDLKKNKSILVTLRGDISDQIPKGATRAFYLSSYNPPVNTDIKSGITQGKDFGFK